MAAMCLTHLKALASDWLSENKLQGCFLGRGMTAAWRDEAVPCVEKAECKN